MSFLPDLQGKHHANRWIKTEAQRRQGSKTIALGPRRSHDGTSLEQVLNTTELLEGIFLASSAKDLHKVMRVCKHWRDSMAESPAI
jgi:hypothetical protein